MGQCTHRDRVDNAPGLIECQCINNAVLYGRCEKHLTPRERAVLVLVDVGDLASKRSELPMPLRRMLHDAIAAVKKSNELSFNTDPEKIRKGMAENADALNEHIKSLESAKYPTQEMLQSEVAIRERVDD